MKQSDHTRCPGCSGNMIFNIEKQMLVCQSCNNGLTVEEYEQVVRDKEEKGIKKEFTSGATPNIDKNDEYTSLNRSYICTSCGGEINPGALRATDTCPFCGNAIVFTSRFRDQSIPDFIVPSKGPGTTLSQISKSRVNSNSLVCL